MSVQECVQCGKEVCGDIWNKGECCIGGSLFACCAECAIQWADANCIAGTPVEQCSGEAEAFALIHFAKRQGGAA